ncbi:hypothetical protein G3M81_12390 [Bacillus paralicheniformis]|uniref:hypothetical protein n=1 Tax=Bacillus TaxID=1386 RepID=UPI0013EF28A6|nr:MULTISPECIES: hypothetical protein [Bacillus]MCY8609901.1 hypothetical protein [Bacillus haynesii]MEC0752133.1 hypothetical protein [Bacillus haynesii]QII49490.1 hypothetical protein G3M81_12390 [Bacillus paralicheniformis]
MNKTLQAIENAIKRVPEGVALYTDPQTPIGDVHIRIGNKIQAIGNKSYAAASVLLLNNAMSLISQARKAEELRAENEQLKQALQIYADERNHCRTLRMSKWYSVEMEQHYGDYNPSFIEVDRGRIARGTLNGRSLDEITNSDVHDKEGVYTNADRNRTN